jgi:hypothetical protein
VPLDLPSEALSIKGIKLEWPRLIAIRGDRLVLVEGRDLILAFEGVGTPRSRSLLVERLGWAPSRVELSPSGRYLLLHSSRGNYALVWDLERNRPIQEVYGPESVCAALNVVDDLDVLVYSKRPGLFAALALQRMEPLFEATALEPTPFVFTAIVPLHEPEMVATVQHRFLEENEALSTLSLSTLRADKGLLPQVLQTEQIDQASKLIVGRAGPGEVLVVRCDQAGISAEDDLDLAIDAVASSEPERIAAVATGREELHAMATRTRVVLVQGRTLQLIPRDGAEEGATAQTVEGSAFGFDADESRLATIAEGGELRILQLPA